MLRYIILLMMCLVLAACGGRQAKPISSSGSYSSRTAYSSATCTAGPKSKYGNPSSYKVMGKRYHVLPSACGYAETGLASWYGPNFHGKRTSSGEAYDMNALSAAHKTLPIPAMVRVTNLENGRQLDLRVNDRGPFHKGRIIDLSKAAAQKLGVIAKGTAKVRVESIGQPNDYVAVGASPKDYRNRMYVQIGSFGERGNAEAMLHRLGNDGFAQAHIEKVRIDSGHVNRVRVGPFSSPAQAEAMAQRLRQSGYRDYKIITE